MDSIVIQRQTDEQIVAEHLAGHRCAECGSRGGCMRMLRIIRRREAHADVLAVWTGIRTGPGRLVW